MVAAKNVEAFKIKYMEAVKILAIKAQYKSGELSYAQASLQLITIGLKADDVITLLTT